MKSYIDYIVRFFETTSMIKLLFISFTAVSVPLSINFLLILQIIYCICFNRTEVLTTGSLFYIGLFIEFSV